MANIFCKRHCKNFIAMIKYYRNKKGGDDMRKSETYIPLVEFLGKALGEHCEVVLHDVSDPEHSIVAIANGHLSGRSIGGSLTDMVLKLLRQGDKEQTQYVVNYHGKGSTGHLFRSSSYFIRSDEGSIIGVLCLNYDVQPYITAREIIDKEILKGLKLEEFLPASHEDAVPADAVENLYKNAGDAIESMIDKRLAEYPVEPKRLSMKERIQVSHDLNEDGLFLLKGGISALAERLEVSEPTVYRYLQRIRREE